MLYVLLESLAEGRVDPHRPEKVSLEDEQAVCGFCAPGSSTLTRFPSPVDCVKTASKIPGTETANQPNM
jgi:hypothetical protein